MRDFLLHTPELPGTYGNVALKDWDHHPATIPWQQTRQQLMTDAEAELPER